jgi:hypothetical protein
MGYIFAYYDIDQAELEGFIHLEGFILSMQIMDP